jgi:hypothetical protein
MKWKYFLVDEHDMRAKAQVIENLEVGAYEHTLSRKLLSRFSGARGPIFLIAFESLDLSGEQLYKYGTYRGGNRAAAPEAEALGWSDYPISGLIEIVDKWLTTHHDGVVVCENWAARCEHLSRHPRESRACCFGDEVYHLLTTCNAGKEHDIECALRESEHHWATGVCSRCSGVPDGSELTEAFIEEVAANTAHIFTPALDGEGYLVWSPA